MSRQTSPKSKGGKSVKEEKTALEKHVAFFDRNGDGVVYPWETYQEKLGTGRLVSAFVGIFINLGLSRKTRPGNGSSPLFPIEVKIVALAFMVVTPTFTTRTEDLWNQNWRRYSRSMHTHIKMLSLTPKEIQNLLETNREHNDFLGWFSAFLEWKILHDLGKDNNGLLTKDTVRGVYDGSLFKQLEKQRSSSSRGKKHKPP